MIVLPLNPPLTPPAKLSVSAVITRVVADDEPVVFPVAVRFIDVAEAAVVPVAAEIMRTPLVSNPADAAPIPDTERIERVPAKELVAEVVFPSAKRFCRVPLDTVVTPETTSEPALNPPLTPPANLIDSSVRRRVCELVAPVVFPNAD